MNARIRRGGTNLVDGLALVVGVVLALVPDRDPAPKSVLLPCLVKWGGLAVVLLLVVLTAGCGPTAPEQWAAVTR